MILDEDKVKELVLCVIKDVYEYSYIGNLEVKKLPAGWMIRIYWRSDQKPIDIMVDIEDAFTLEKFLRQEFRVRKLHYSNHFEGEMTLPYDNCRTSKECRCYEKRKNRR